MANDIRKMRELCSLNTEIICRIAGYCFDSQPRVSLGPLLATCNQVCGAVKLLSEFRLLELASADGDVLDALRATIFEREMNASEIRSGWTESTIEALTPHLCPIAASLVAEEPGDVDLINRKLLARIPIERYKGCSLCVLLWVSWAPKLCNENILQVWLEGQWHETAEHLGMEGDRSMATSFMKTVYLVEDDESPDNQERVSLDTEWFSKLSSLLSLPLVPLPDRFWRTLPPRTAWAGMEWLQMELSRSIHNYLFDSFSFADRPTLGTIASPPMTLPLKELDTATCHNSNVALGKCLLSQIGTATLTEINDDIGRTRGERARADRIAEFSVACSQFDISLDDMPTIRLTHWEIYDRFNHPSLDIFKGRATFACCDDIEIEVNFNGDSDTVKGVCAWCTANSQTRSCIICHIDNFFDDHQPVDWQSESSAHFLNFARGCGSSPGKLAAFVVLWAVFSKPGHCIPSSEVIEQLKAGIGPQNVQTLIQQ
eukprot:gnl/MRDRNA2_/MRDRNA2_154894_c0_seq1.p1 gnl/MRDRNA2_/MRDRNA2_154894_c0~~gnl/MRDRNA2_/MRDRNA2_154894_c0_seq1.p1  ORF type:complete len:503 (+),score=50.88 gnl/MRDRNA2_/MRDRNA2_154894_c0_seq1:50-1510(+)